MQKILVTRRLLRSCEDKAKETFNPILNLNDEIIYFLQMLSQAFLIFGLFCIGSQFDTNEIKSITSKPLIMAVSIWVLVIPSAYILVKYF